MSQNFLTEVSPSNSGSASATSWPISASTFAVAATASATSGSTSTPISGLTDQPILSRPRGWRITSA